MKPDTHLTSLSEEGEITYYKKNRKFVVNSSYAYIMAYESDDDFYDEQGILSFEDGEVVYVSEIVRVFGDLELTDDWIQYLYEKHGVNSMAELKATLEQYITEGKESEFWNN